MIQNRTRLEYGHIANKRDILREDIKMYKYKLVSYKLWDGEKLKEDFGNNKEYVIKIDPHY